MNKVILAVLAMLSFAVQAADYSKELCAEVKISTAMLAEPIISRDDIPDMEEVMTDVVNDSVDQFGKLSGFDDGYQIQQTLFFLKENHLMYSMYLRYYRNNEKDTFKAAHEVAKEMSELCFSKLDV